MDNLMLQLKSPPDRVTPRGIRVWLETSRYLPSISELERLAWALEMHDMKLVGWTQVEELKTPPPPGERVNSESATKVDRGEARPESHKSTALGEHEQEMWSEAALVSRSLRAGQMVRYAGTVVVFGDVNPGAVIVADGNVIVWGKLRGVVHAGAGGDDQAVVGALELAPSQLRIGKHAGRVPDQNMEFAPVGEVARIRDGRVVIEDWDDGKV